MKGLKKFYRNKVLHWVAIIFLFSISMIQIFLFFSNFYEGTISYDGSNVTSQIKSEYLEGVRKILYSNQTALEFNDKRYLGVYHEFLRTIKVSVTQDNVPLLNLMVHELAHHHWNTRMTWEEKSFWKITFDNLGEEELYKYQFPDDAGELHSRYYERHPGKFLVNYCGETKVPN